MNEHLIVLADDLERAMDLLQCPCGRHTMTKDRVFEVEQQLRALAHLDNDAVEA